MHEQPKDGFPGMFSGRAARSGGGQMQAANFTCVRKSCNIPYGRQCEHKMARINTVAHWYYIIIYYKPLSNASTARPSVGSGCIRPPVSCCVFYNV